MNKLGQIHQVIYNDGEWREYANIIGALKADDNVIFGLNQGMMHWFNVSNIASDFAKDAGGNGRDIALADIAGLLCGIGLSCGTFNASKNGATLARAFLRGRWGYSVLSDEDINVICHAIAIHTLGKDIQNIVDAAVCMGEALDVNKERVLKAVTPCHRVLKDINKAAYKLDGNLLVLNYTVSKQFSTYDYIQHCPDAYAAPINVAKFMGREFRLLLNGKESVTLPI